MASGSGKKAPLVKPTHYPPYERKGKRRTAPARATSALAKTMFPAPCHSRHEQKGYMGLKEHSKRPLWEDLEQCYKWLTEDFHIVFCPRSEIDDPDDYERLMVTQSGISDFTLDSFIFSVFAEVQSLPFLRYPFNIANERKSEHTEEWLEKFNAIIEKLQNFFVDLKRQMKKVVENDAYFLNAQTRAHTIWFLEKFFSQDLVAPEVVDDRKVSFEVLMPPPLPEGVPDHGRTAD